MLSKMNQYTTVTRLDRLKYFGNCRGFFTVEVSLKQKYQIGLPQVAYSFSENGGKKKSSRILKKRKFRARDCFVTRLDR